MADEKQQAKKSKARRCPVCGEETESNLETFPFCSSRCKMADLGRWFSGDYRITRKLEESDLDELE